MFQDIYVEGEEWPVHHLTSFLETLLPNIQFSFAEVILSFSNPPFSSTLTWLKLCLSAIYRSTWASTALSHVKGIKRSEQESYSNQRTIMGKLRKANIKVEQEVYVVKKNYTSLYFDKQQ